MFAKGILCVDVCLTPAVDSSSIVSLGASDGYALAHGKGLWALTKQLILRSSMYLDVQPAFAVSHPQGCRPGCWHLHKCLILRL